MFVSDVTTSADHRLHSILHTLQKIYGVDIALDESSIEQLEALHESSEIIKNSIINEGGFNSWHTDPNYAKHMLIMEAVRLYLTEIAPRRRPRKLSESVDAITEDSHTKLGRWMMDFSEKARTGDDKLLAVLNSFGRVGDDLIRIGEPFGVDSFADLLAGYEARAQDESNDEHDRRQAQQNLQALRIAKRLYAKHHREENDMTEETAQQMADATVGEAKLSPELMDLMHKYGVSEETMAEAAVDEADVEEGDAFQAARLKRIKAGGRNGDKFEVAGEEFTLQNVGPDDIERAKGISEMNSRLGKALTEDHMQNHDYQASMARSELYRNAKYGMDMLKMIRPEDEIEPWIAAALTKSAMYLDKIYHYMDYYDKFEPNELGEQVQPDFDDMDDEAELGETSGSVARMNLMHIVDDSIKLFNKIQPGDHLEGWVAMKLTKASECISSSKHYLDYKNFEKHASEDYALEESVGIEEAPTRKDFKIVADLISKHPDAEARHHLAKHHAEIFAKQNPRFNKGRFFAAAKADANPRSKKKVSEAVDQAEQGLQQAQTLIAAKSISDDLQSMAEKVARMGVDDLMPLVDTMKTQFGPEAADAYNTVMKQQLDDVLNSVQTAKDQSDNAVLALQGGGIPGQGASDIENVPMAAPGDEAGAEQPDMGAGDGLGTSPVDAGGAEPLGRAKKPAPGEEPVAEAWDAEMKTAEKDKGKWDGYSIADLKAKKKKLMDKETRSAAEQKTVKQIDFAIRAKQKDKWGKIKEGNAAAAKSSTQMTLPMDLPAQEKPAKTGKYAADIDKWEAIAKQTGSRKRKNRPAVNEAAKSPYAIGMWQAKKEHGLDPDKPAHDLPKKVVKRAHEIGKSIEGTDESVAKLGKLVEKAIAGQRKYSADLAAHRETFAKKLAEGKVKDTLKTGQGLEGDLLVTKIEELARMQGQLSEQIRALEVDSKSKLLDAIKQERKLSRFAEAKAQKPWGVMYEDQEGKRKSKFFEDQKARDYWVQLNDGVKAALINPEHFDIVTSK